MDSLEETLADKRSEDNQPGKAEEWMLRTVIWGGKQFKED